MLLALSVTLWIGPGCERFPRDPNHTLEHVLERGTLRVGVLDGQTPWVAGQPPGDPGGVEGLLLGRFADELGVDVGVRLHEEGHTISGELFVVLSDSSNPAQKLRQIAEYAAGIDWRLYDLVVMPVETVKA